MPENAVVRPAIVAESRGEDRASDVRLRRASAILVLALHALLLLFGLAVAGTAQETWAPTATAGAPSFRRDHKAVWTGSKMIVWGGSSHEGASGSGDLNTGGVYDPTTDTWTAMSTTNTPSARAGHSAVWTGSKMIIWGGFDGSSALNTGGIYDPAADTWTAVSTASAPTGRSGSTAVWTGSKMVIWGGGAGASYPNTGGLYDPATDTWTAMSTVNAPAGRGVPAAVWTGSRMIVWGGGDPWSTNTGGIYDPASDTWTAMSTTSAPSSRVGHSALWTGTRMVVWGGAFFFLSVEDPLDSGGIYDPATDTWTTTSTTNAPTSRSAHTAVWTGSKMIVWGGGFYWSDLTNTGGIYDPNLDVWTTTSTTNAPAARGGAAAVWTGSKMIAWGGARPDFAFLNTGGVYTNPALLPVSPVAADFHTVTPCRLVDTRNPAGPSGGPALYPGATRAFAVTGGACGIPSTATAVSVNVTAVGATAQGRLTLYRGDDTSTPLASSINFTPGVTRASNAIVLLATSAGTINVQNASAGTVHLVLDVSGYFQ